MGSSPRFGTFTGGKPLASGHGVDGESSRDGREVQKMELAGDRRAMIVGFAVALTVLAALALVVGLEELLASLAAANYSVVALMVAVALAWLCCWALALRTVLGVLGIEMSVATAVQTFLAAMFANNVTPFGQAGGEPVAAFFISTSSDAEYETSLAAIASVDALNFVPSIAFALLGLAFFSARHTVGQEFRMAAAAVLSLAVAVPVVAALGWRYRRRVEALVLGTVAPAIGSVGRRLPRVPTEETVREQIQSFFESIDRVATDRRGLAVALAFSALGWLGIMTSLWLALYALGYTVAFAVVLVAVPVGAVAGVAPLPGGLGGVETVLVALLVPIPELSAAAAAAAVVLHRGATYWLPLVLGGAAAGTLGAHRLT